MRKIIVIATAAVGLLLASAAQAAPLTPAEQSRLAGLMIEAVDGKAPADRAAYRPVLVIDDGLPMIGGVTAFGAPVTVLSRTQARDQQRAYFIKLSKLSNLEKTADGVVLIYGRLATAQSGRITFVRDGDGWKIAGHDSDHSSSGARYGYGELYDGVACRDGTEMAQRWNTAVQMQKAIEAGKSFKDALSVEAPAKCPGKEFPEVAVYRDMKAMRGR